MDEVIEVPGVTEDELQQSVVDRITAICKPKLPIQEDEVLIDQMVKAWGFSRSTTVATLDRQVAEGKLTKRKTNNPKTGRECWVYREVLPEDEQNAKKDPHP